MSPARLGYKELGLGRVSLEDKTYCTNKWPLMEGEKKYYSIGYPLKIFFKESLMQ
jgi:hypothetical protein